MSYDLLVAGTSVTTYAAVVSYDGVFSAAPLRGSDLVIPSRRGETAVAKVRDAYTFSVPLIATGSTQGAYQDKVDSLRALVDTGYAAKTVTRVKPTAAGDLTTTCTAMCELIEGELYPDAVNGRLVLGVRNLDGCWYASSASTPTIPATITVAGSTQTHRITLVLPGAGTLTNTTLGVSVAVTGAATLTVETKATTGTLSAITAAGDPFGNWFALAPGSNTITWSGAGTPTISYYAAYL